ncbi:MAG: agglutinin biogenesis protein MshI, partial [Rhodocyclales bacterium CG17_big_fil_post_rev_8_21_14_2_50_68_7]
TMKLFGDRHRPGWLAVEVASDAVRLAHVRRAATGRPRVLLCESWRKEGSDADTLARLRASRGLGGYRCATALDFGEYHMLQVDAPAVPPEELKSAVRWRVKDLLDYPADEATIDVLDIPADDGATTRARSVFAVCAPNAVIGRHVRLFQAARVPLSVIDIPETAQRNIAALFEPVGRGVAMLGLGEGGGLLTFTFGGELYLSRRIDIGAPQILEAAEPARAALFDRIVLELQRSLDHFEHQFHFISLAKVLVAPLPAETGLAGHLAANLAIGVETPDLGSVLDLEAVPSVRQPAMQAQYLRLLGVALRDEEARA